MAGLDDFDAAGWPAIAVAGDGEAGQACGRQANQVEIVPFSRLGHGTGGLANCYQLQRRR